MGEMTESKYEVPREIAAICGRTVEVALIAGNKQKAIHAIEEAWKTSPAFKKVDLLTPVGDLFGPKLNEDMFRAGIRTVGDLLEFSQMGLSGIKGISFDIAGKVNDYLRLYGFELKSRSEKW